MIFYDILTIGGGEGATNLPTEARRAKNVSKISAQLWSPRAKLSLSSPRAQRKTSSLVTSRREKKTSSSVTSRIAQREVTNDEVFL